MVVIKNNSPLRINVSFSGSLDSIRRRGPLSGRSSSARFIHTGRSQHPSFDPIILSNSNPGSQRPEFPEAAASSEASYSANVFGASWKLKSRVRQIDRRVVDRWLATPLFEQLPVDPDYRRSVLAGFPSVKLGFALKRREKCEKYG